MGRMMLPGRVMSRHVRGPSGEDAVKIEHLSVAAGDAVEVVFEAWSKIRRQGLWVAVDGVLDSGGDHASQFNFWANQGHDHFYFKVTDANGDLVFYNIWEDPDVGRQSQNYMSGMLVEELEDGWRRYRCTDKGSPPDFSRLIVRLKVYKKGTHRA